MMKRILLLLLLCPFALLVRAQWTAKDSLNLDRILQGKEEIKLNIDAVKQIEFDPFGAPCVSEDKPWMRIDETLPEVRKKKKVVLTLHPYKANTKYNWDPVYQRKINIDADTWKMNTTDLMPTNWAKSIVDKGIRRSVEEIRASGLHQNILGERANGMMVRSYTTTQPVRKVGNKGATLTGNGVGGLDLMTVFTKDFWDKKGRKARERTLEVLKAYGDSTTVLIPHDVLEPITH